MLEANFKGGGCLEGKNQAELINNIVEFYYDIDLAAEVVEILEDGEVTNINLEEFQKELDEQLKIAREDYRITCAEREEVEQEYQSNLI